MITAEQLQDNVVAAIQAGVDEYIVKPFTPKTLKDKLITVTRRRLREINSDIKEYLESHTPGVGAGEPDAGLNGRLKDFRARLLKLMEISSWSHIIPLELGRLSFKAGDYEDAEKWLRKVLSIDFGLSEAHHLLSLTLRKLGKINESIRELEIAVVERPKSGDLKQKLGEAYMQEGKYARAIELITESIAIFNQQKDRKKLARSRNSLGQAKIIRGEKENDETATQDAERDIREAVTLDPGLMAAHYNLMVVYKKTGRDADAAKQLDRIRRMEPNDAEGWIVMGKMYLHRSEIPKAKFAFKKADGLSEGKFAVYEEISTLLYNHKIFDEALTYLDKAVEANPSDIFSYNLKGIIYRTLDRHKEAIREYTAAVKLEPDNPGLIFNLGVAYFKSGEEKKSMEIFAKVKTLDPGFREADEYLKRLEAK